MLGRWSGGSSREPGVNAGAVIVAAGAGRRMGGVRKQFLEIAGEPVLLRALRPFLQHPGIGPVVIVLPADDAADPPSWLRELPVEIVPGGAARGDSVAAGLRALPDAADPVLIHDGARPFVTPDIIGRVLNGARDHATIAAVRVADTIKEVDETGRIRHTPDRRLLWQAQTPQGFRRSLIEEVYQRARDQGIGATDDAALCERFGVAVHVVEGHASNIKITHPSDLSVAEALAAAAL